MKLHTIGFTQRSAEDFFETLKSARIDRLIDVRLNNISQLSGYSTWQMFSREPPLTLTLSPRR